MRLSRLGLPPSLLPALFITVGAAATPTERAPSFTKVERAGIELLRGLRDPAAPVPEVSGVQLAELGSGTVDLLLTVLEERAVPGPGLPGREDQPEQILSLPQRQTILKALTLLGSSAVTARLDERFSAPETLAQRRVQVEVLGAVGGSPALLSAVEHTRVEEGELDPRLAEALEEAVGSILRRHPRGYQVLEREWPKLSELELGAIVRGVGGTRDPRGLPLLADLLNFAPTQRRLIAAQVPLVAPSDDARVNNEMATLLLDQLDSDDEHLVRAAILGLGCLEDFNCVPRLIELLASDSAALRANAHHALVQLLNKPTRPTHKLWESWYRKEQLWSERESSRVLADLDSPRQEAVLRALKELGLRRLDRHRLALRVAVLLEHPTESIRITACDALAGLGSRWAIEPLREAFDGGSATMRTSAGKALRAITGEDRPEEDLAWSDVHGPRSRND